MRGSNFIFDLGQLIYSKCHRVNFIRGGLYIVSPDQIKKKKSLLNPKNTGNKCFQYAEIVALNYEETESHPVIFSFLMAFIGKYNWKVINYPSEIDDW